MTQTLKLADIRIDGGTQPRESINQEYVGDLANEADVMKLPPLTVFHDGTDYWLADGFHRYHALKSIQVAEFPCEVHTGTQRDAVWYSLAANTSHGLRRTNADKRKAVRIALADPQWAALSSFALAGHIGVSHRMIQDVKNELGVESGTVTGRDGKQYPARKQQKSSGPPPSRDEVASNATPPPPIDRLGQPITDPDVAAAFAESQRITELYNLIADAKRVAVGLSTEPVGAELRLQRLEADLTNAMVAVKAAAPFTTCPYMPACASGCKVCRTKKWITESQWNQVPSELKA